MNEDQEANIHKAVEALGKSLAAAWSYFFLLKGMHEGIKDNQKVLEKFAFLYDRTWRAVFDGFFAKVGTLLDSTKGTYSLPNLITMIRRYGNPELKKLIIDVESSLKDKESNIAKLQNWRHDAVAHNAVNRDDSEFYIENKMTMAEIEDALDKLEDLLNHLSWNVLSVHNDTKSKFERLVDDGISLFNYTAIGIRKESIS